MATITEIAPYATAIITLAVLVYRWGHSDRALLAHIDVSVASIRAELKAEIEAQLKPLQEELKLLAPRTEVLAVRVSQHDHFFDDWAELRSQVKGDAMELARVEEAIKWLRETKQGVDVCSALRAQHGGRCPAEGTVGP